MAGELTSWREIFDRWPVGEALEGMTAGLLYPSAPPREDPLGWPLPNEGYLSIHRTANGWRHSMYRYLDKASACSRRDYVRLVAVIDLSTGEILEGSALKEEVKRTKFQPDGNS